MITGDEIGEGVFGGEPDGDAGHARACDKGHHIQAEPVHRHDGAGHIYDDPGEFL